MDVVQALQTRRSIRAFKDARVDKDTILKIMEAAKKTPSWANTQPWELFVATGEPLERLRKRFLETFRSGVTPDPDITFPKEWPEAHMNRTRTMGKARFATLGIERHDKEARNKFTENNYKFFGAPAVIFVCMDRALTQWSLFDLGAISQSIMLVAEHYGLNTVPAVMMASYPNIIREELKIPAEFSIAIGIALGYGDMDNILNEYITERRPVDDFLTIIE
ncbi:MAG: nitroreductase [Peptococcales bacterium]|jgi:nitroreductase